MRTTDGTISCLSPDELDSYAMAYQERTGYWVTELRVRFPMHLDIQDTVLSWCEANNVTLTECTASGEPMYVTQPGGIRLPVPEF